MPPAVLGSFRISALLARGGMGEVWHGEHVEQGTPVAVKIITARAASDEIAMDRFRSEVRAVARLSHPGIVLVLDHGQVDDTPYLVMELAEGTLGRAWAPTSFRELRGLLASTLGALAHAHAHDVVHRDIKPGNVLVTRSGGEARFKLADFGLAHALDVASPFDRDLVSGTPRYMAPEQIKGHWRDQGPWTDLYAVGCIAYRFACGSTPYTGVDAEVLAAHLVAAPPRLEPIFAVPAGFEAWVHWLLAKSPADRCGHAADAFAALEAMEDVADAVVRASPQATAPADDLQQTTLAVSDPRIVLAPPPEAPPAEPLPPPIADRRPPPAFERVLELAPARPEASLLGAGLGLYGLRPVPLVGRVRERQQLWETLESVHETRRPHAVLLRGVAGTGKSRLAEWLARTAAEVGAAVPLRVTHGPIPGPSHGFDAAIAAALRCGGLEPAQAAARIREQLAGYGASGSDLDDEVDPLTELVCPASDPQKARVRFESEAQRHLVIRRFLDRWASSRPVVVWAEDAQWGADTLRVVDALTREGELSALFVLTARDEVLGDRQAEPRLLEAMEKRGALRTIDVEPLPPADHAELVRQLLGLEGALARDVTSRTMGNPLFAVQLVGEWVQRGALVATPDGFRVGPQQQAIVPDDIHALWTSRVERLLADIEPAARPAVRRSLEVAAALGIRIDGREWEKASEHAGASTRAGVVEAMVARRLAVDEPEGWSFSHEMLRESLERDARDAGRAASLHRACAAMLEERYGAARRGIAERLARHRLAAGDGDQAAADMLRAATERAESGDFAAAHALFAERGELLAKLGAGTDDERWAHGWRAQALACAQQGNLVEGEDAARKLLDFARRNGRLDLRAEAECSLAPMAHRRGAIDEALGYAQAALDHAREVGDHRVAGRALLALGQLHARRGELDPAEAAYREGVATLDRYGAPFVQANARYLLGTLLMFRGLYDDSTKQLGEARRGYEKLGARAQIAICDGDLGETARLRGDLDAAEGHYRRAARMLEALGSNDAYVPRINLAFVALARGRYGEAHAMLDACLVGLSATGHGAYLPYVHAALLPCLASTGDWAGWDEHFAAARRMLGEMALVQDDLATCFELAAGLAAEAGHGARAAGAYAFARAQWIAAGKPERAARIDDALAATTPESSR
jgi:tetratricopeptide (TPR) repeat protein